MPVQSYVPYWIIEGILSYEMSHMEGGLLALNKLKAGLFTPSTRMIFYSKYQDFIPT